VNYNKIIVLFLYVYTWLNHPKDCY